MTNYINGYPILSEFPTPGGRGTRAGRVILIQRGTVHQPYVTAWAGNGDDEWAWGHYYDSREEAAADYLKRCERGY